MTGKIVIVGDANVGKSCLIHYWIYEYSMENTYPTIGAGFFSKNVILKNEKKIKFCLWDTAGQERFRSIISTYYRGAHGCICVCDMTNKNSFENLENWIDEYRSGSNIENGIVLILGNKIDKEKPWQVSETDIISLANKKNTLYGFTSGVTGQGIKHSFNQLCETIVNSNIINEVISTPTLVVKKRHWFCF